MNKVGELTLSEARECKARSDILRKLQNDLQELTSIINIIKSEYQLVGNQILTTHGLSLDDGPYEINVEEGTILRETESKK
jgi:hypothetical protein